jgi:hypothetical protein
LSEPVLEILNLKLLTAKNLQRLILSVLLVKHRSFPKNLKNQMFLKNLNLMFLNFR